MKILQVCYKLPFPPNDGGAYSLYNSALGLLRTDKVKLKVLALKQRKNRDDEALIPTHFREQTQLEFVEIDNRLKPFKAIQSLFQSSSYFADRFYSTEFEKKLIEVIQNQSFDIIQLEHSYLAVYLPSLKKHFSGKIILRAQNVEFKLWENYILSSKLIFPIKFYLKVMTKRLAKLEANLLNEIDGLICLSEEDKNSFLEMNNRITCKVIPIGFDEERLPSTYCVPNTPSIYHLGSMDWRPNLQGIDWFLKSVLPELRKSKQKITIHLAGKNMPNHLKNLSEPEIVVDGEIPDSIDYQKDKSILIVPLLSGGGIRVKIIEALALGKVIVSTSKGAEGLNIEHGKNGLIANSPEQFSKAILDCFGDPKLMQRLSENARALFLSHYQLSQTGEQSKQFYDELFN